MQVAYSKVCEQSSEVYIYGTCTNVSCMENMHGGCSHICLNEGSLVVLSHSITYPGLDNI